MNEEKFGIVAYNNVKKSSDIYLHAFNDTFRNESMDNGDSINFVKAWDSVDSLIDFVNNNGVPILNTLNKIIIMDEGFKTQTESVNMVNKFISLQQVFANRGVNMPYLCWAASNKQVWDIFKTNIDSNTFDGQQLIEYNKTRIFSLNKDANGQISMSQIVNIVTGRADNSAITIRHDYQDRGDITINQAKRMKQSILSNAKIETINKLKEQLKSEANNNGIETEKLTNKDKHNKQVSLFNNEHERDDVSKIDKIKSNLIDNDNSLNNNNFNDSSNNNNDNNFNNDKEELTQKDILETYHNINKEKLNYNDKLSNDKSTILFTGRSGSGLTSTIYNIASIYELYNRQVLIVNLDLYDDILKYYPEFAKYYNDKNLSKVFSSSFVNVDDLVIKVNHNLSIMSDLGESQREQSVDTKTRSLKRIVTYAKHNYDIILIDCGPYFNEVYSRIGDDVDDIVIETSLENLPTLDNFSTNKNNLNSNIVDFIINKNCMPGIIINKVDFKAKNQEIISQIRQLNTSLSNCRLISSIPYDRNWNVQAQSKIPYSMQNKYNFEQLVDLTKGVVV